MFPGEHGKYLPRPKSTRGWFAGAVKRAGVQSVTPHDLRHTTASLSISAGINVLVLARMLGHTSVKVTLDVYAYLFDTDLDAAANTLHASYSATSVPTGGELEHTSRMKKPPTCKDGGLSLAVAEGFEPITRVQYNTPFRP